MYNDIYINYFLKVVEFGSFTKAANFLGISQPALSFGITHLEKDVGVILLNRKSAPITLTEEGKIFLEYCNNLKSLEINLRKEIDDCSKIRNSSLRVGGSIVYVQSLISNALYDLNDYKISIKVGSLDELIKMSDNNQLDCFISATNKLDSKFMIKNIKREKVYICVPKKYEINSLIDKKNIDYSLFNDNDFIVLEDGQPLQENIDKFFVKYKINCKREIVINQVSSCLSLVKKGLGICFASEFAINNKDQNYIAYPLPSDMFDRYIYVVYDKTHYQSEACTDFINRLIGDNK